MEGIACEKTNGGTKLCSAGRYAGIDGFRLAAAVMVTAIHTAPFSGISGSLDFLITYCAGRAAVPFFLMITGYFVLGPWKAQGCLQDGKVMRFLRKTMFLYAVSVVLYVPVNLYSGSIPESVGSFLKMLLFDGTFYHLWYFPAVILGCLIVMGLAKRFSAGTAAWVCAALYLIGAGGDSFYGLVSRIPAAETFYQAIFTVSSYTRNGIFYAPVFLFLGMLLGQRRERCARRADGLRRNTQVTAACAAGFCISMGLMMAEGYLTYRFGLQRHNSMYLFLIPVMYFLFRLLLLVPGKAPGGARDISMIVYIIHPLVLIVLRGFARAAGLGALLIENAFVQFAAVTAASFVLAWLIETLNQRVKKRKEGRGDV